MSSPQFAIASQLVARRALAGAGGLGAGVSVDEDGGGVGTETVQALWRSDADPGGLPALPAGVTPQFLLETGASQDVTALLVASATASGFAFPSNITVQVQSDVEPVPAPLIGFGLPVFLASGGVLFGAKLLERRLIYRNPAVVAGAPEPA